MKKLLEYLFPPKLPVFNIEKDIPEIENYQYRISRRGMDLNPALFYAGSAEKIEGQNEEVDFTDFDDRTNDHNNYRTVGGEA